MLRITLTGGQELVDALEAKGPAITRVLMSKTTELMTMLASYIVSQKLQGQVLQHQTGKLAGSIRAIPAVLEGTTIVGTVQGAGGPAWYGKLYETLEAGGTAGVSHAWPIVATKARALAFVVDGKKVFAHSVVHPALSARPFMTPALEENATTIQTQLQAALDAEVDTL